MRAEQTNEFLMGLPGKMRIERFSSGIRFVEEDPVRVVLIYDHVEAKCSGLSRHSSTTVLHRSLDKCLSMFRLDVESKNGSKHAFSSPLRTCLLASRQGIPQLDVRQRCP